MATNTFDPRADLPLRILVSGASTVILIAGLRQAADVLNPILLALLLALCLSPALTALTSRGVKKPLAAAIIVVGFLAIAIVTTGIVAHSATGLLQELPHYENRAGASLGEWRSFVESKGIHVDQVVPTGEEAARRLMGAAREVVRAILALVSQSVVVMLLTVLFVMELAHERDASPRTGPLAQTFARIRETAGPIRRYMGITALAGAANALANLALLVVIGVPHPGLFAVVSFFFNFVPAVGNLLAMVPPAALALFVLGPQHAIAVVVGYMITNLLADNVLKPAAMAKGLDVSIVEIFLSLLAWGYVFGPTGAILAVPLTLSLRYALFERGAAPPTSLEAAS